MSVAAPLLTDDRAYTAVEACRLAGSTYRMVDYWARTRLVVPSVRRASGSGYWHRLYSTEDVRLLRAITKLVDAGVSLPAIRRGLASMTMPRFIDEMAARLEMIGRGLYEADG